MNIDWAEFSKLFVSFIGGVITTIIAQLLIAQREKRKDVRKLKVFGDIEIIGGPNSLPFAMHIVITAVNDGYRPITIMNVGLIMEDSSGTTKNHSGISSRYEPWPSLPKTIADGEAVKFYMELSVVLDLVSLLNENSNDRSVYTYPSTVYVKDAEGNEYKAKLHPEKMSIINNVASGKLPPTIENKD